MNRTPLRLAIATCAVLATPPSDAWAGWVIETPEPSSSCLCWYTSLALDAQGRPHVAHNASALPFLVAKLGTQWSGESVVPPPTDPNGRTPESDGSSPHGPELIYYIDPSLVLDQAGAPSVAYLRQWDNRLHFAWKEGGVWQDELVSIFASSPALALDASGTPAMVYGSAGQTWFAWRTSSWNAEPIDPQPGVGASLGFDALGQPHVAYGSYSGTTRLKHASRVGNVWTAEIVDSTGGTGGETALAVDHAGGVHLAYTGPGQRIGYAVRRAGGWQVETVTEDGGFHCSLALDAGDNPCISYHRESTGDLRFARQVNGEWTDEPVEESGEVGEFNSLVIDGEGHPQISYFDATNQRVRFARGEALLVGIGAPTAAAFALERSGPNPLRMGGELTLSVALPGPRRVELALYDVAGRRAASQLAEPAGPGVQTMRWRPVGLRAGLYFLRLRTDFGEALQSRLIVLP
jgi:hypothetical protein